MNPELEICHLAEGARFEMTLTIGRGRGYVAADGNKGPETTIGVIPVDSIFSPVRRVAVRVDSGPRRSAHRLRQADARRRDRRLDQPARRAAAGRRDPDQAARDLHRPRHRRPAALGRRRRRRRRGRGAAGARDGEHPDRGARARRPLLQLPQARRHRDDRRPGLEDRAGARRDPELRQEVDRRGARRRSRRTA